MPGRAGESAVTDGAAVEDAAANDTAPQGEAAQGCPPKCHRARCEHKMWCSRHCPHCPEEPKRRRGRPRKLPYPVSTSANIPSAAGVAPSVAEGASAPKRQRTTNARAPGSLREVEEHEGLTFDDSDEHVRATEDPQKRLRDLFFHLGLEEWRLRRMLSAPRRTAAAKLAEPDPVAAMQTDSLWNDLVLVMEKAMERVAEALCPGAGNTLIEAVQQRAAATSNELQDVALEHYKLSVKLVHKAERLSLERRVGLALLSHGMSRYNLGKVTAAAGHAVRLNDVNYCNAKTDLDALCEGKGLPVYKFSRQTFDKDVLCKAIKFFIAESNVCVLSWGTRAVKLDQNTTVVLPSLTRRRTRTRIWEAYQEQAKEAHDGEGKPRMIGRSTAFKILSLITNGQKRAISAVNYLLGELIYDNFILVNRIIERCTGHDLEQRKELKLHATITSNFLKTQYPKHVAMTDNILTVCTHGLEYALLPKSQSAPAKAGMDCSGCKFVPFFFDELREAVRRATPSEDRRDHVLKAVDRCEAKTVLWRGQCARVANQQKAIAGLHEGMAKRCKDNKWMKPRECVVVMDFKMKYLPPYFRQKSIEHFGKRGISWHGFLVVFYVFNPDTDKAEREHVYADQILMGTNKQDGPAIAGLVEAFLYQLKRSVSFEELESVVLQSDNAKYYHSQFLIFSLPYIGVAAGLQIKSYIHTETADGNGLIDAHFAMAMRYVDAYIGEGNNAAGPMEVFKALAYHGGIPNSFAQLITFDEAASAQRAQQSKATLAGLKPHIKRRNEILFDFAGDVELEDTGNPYSCKGILTIKMWNFSGIGTPDTFEVDPRAGTVVAKQVRNQGGDDSEEEEEEGDGEEAWEGHVGTGLLPGPVVFAGVFGASTFRATILGKLRHEQERDRRAITRPSARSGDRQGSDEADAHPVGEDTNAAAALLILGGGGASDVVDVDEEAGLLQEQAVQRLEEEAEFQDKLQAVDERGRGLDTRERQKRIGQRKAQRTAQLEAATARRDICAAAVLSLSKMLEEREVGVYIRDGRNDPPEYELAVTSGVNLEGRILRQGWASRPPRGKTKGPTNVEFYFPKIAELFAAEGDNKQHPSWFLEVIVDSDEFKDRFDHPSESDVRNAVQRLLGYRKRCKAAGVEPDYHNYLVNGVSNVGGASNGGGRGGPRSQLDGRLEQFIQEHAERLTSTALLNAALADGSGLDEGLQELLASDAQLKDKFKKRVQNVRQAIGASQSNNLANSVSKAGGASKSGGRGGPHSQLDGRLEAYIQAHAQRHTSAALFKAALADGSELDEDLKGRLRTDTDLANKFKKRVQNVRSTIGASRGN